MSRPWVLVVLLLLIVFTSQFEWKQPFGNEIEVSPTISQKQQHSSKREEAVKEKRVNNHLGKQVIKKSIRIILEHVLSIMRREQREEARQAQDIRSSWKKERVVHKSIILSQEKNIRKLNELIQSLKEQLLQCRSENFLNDSAIPLNKHVDELELQPTLED